ncbi:glutamate 5-kinase [Mesobacillus maritimus]|uniref:glutamate 5-kinase n=1 Tax=Mesobacillus maritimus TaxID=1643336 RepID=UPI00203D54FA|nr:glutamate 5-kinase [Mesobacillus maritimus]MCM3587528.1 glutamate 5-kinase [Mesobacillus maritimus]MCM3671174.1 glutamate 5-kinase [Mesobacillus maritimus]
MFKQEKQIKRVVIKIGSSSLTSMHGEISRRKLENLADQIVALKDAGYETAVVSSGAVAAGYRKLGCIERPTSLPEKQAAASIGQGLLMESYSELFLSHGYVASQILITRSDFSDEKRFENMQNTMNVLLERGIIPIINENDTVTVDRLRFGDNDTLAAKVAGLIDADLLIILSDIDGLYDSNPNDNPDAKLLERVTCITPEIEAAAGGSGSAVGTGGMKSKIEAVEIAMAAGIDSFLGKAGCENILMDAVAGNARGTYFEQDPDVENLDNKKQWIAFHSGPEGNVIISAQGKAAIIDENQNLYRSDIIEVSGEFCPDAVVRIFDETGVELGLGRINYSNEQLREDVLETEAKAAIEQETFVCSLDFKLPAFG